jgi:sigma-B regulation protein RsbU (phosphoserine phosphatase)
VSGKGIGAALLMAFVRPVMRTALDRSGDPVEALNRTNRILVEERPTGLLVTVLAATLDLDSGELVFANAGHEPPLLVPGDGAEPSWIEGHGALIGAFRNPELERCSVMIPPAGRVLLYTDGITDATSPAGDRYGEARLRDAAMGLGGQPAGSGDHVTAGATVQGVIDGVLRFQGEADPADDLALLVLRRLPAGRDP